MGKDNLQEDIKWRFISFPWVLITLLQVSKVPRDQH